MRKGLDLNRAPLFRARRIEKVLVIIRDATEQSLSFKNGLYIRWPRHAVDRSGDLYVESIKLC